MSENAKMRVAMVGVGGYGGARRRSMRGTGLFEIVAAYDINDKALAAAEKDDGARPVGSYEELLDTPDVEAMIISTGAKFHAAQALAAMERGLHVFVEKPLCSTVAEMHALLEAQSKTGLVVGVGHKDHSNDAFSVQLKGMIDRGELGKVATFELTTAHSGGLGIQPGDWRGDPEKNPGGMLFQCGVHAFHELIFLFGPVRRVRAAMSYDVHTTGTADVAQCIVEMASGLIGTLGAYHVTPYRHTFNVYGTRMNVYVNDRCFDEGASIFTQTTHCDGKREPMAPLEVTGESDPAGNVRSFYRAVRGRDRPYPSLRDGALAVAAVFAAAEAAETGRTVEIPAMQ